MVPCLAVMHASSKNLIYEPHLGQLVLVLLLQCLVRELATTIPQCVQPNSNSSQQQQQQQTHS